MRRLDSRGGQSTGFRWVDHNAHYVIEEGILKLRVDESLPFRPHKSTPCVSCIQTSDHRFGATTDEYQILDKFAQKMFVLMALFQYSGWTGKVDPNMTYPKDFEIDYVRVYARDSE